MKNDYLEDDLQEVLRAIVNGASIRKASLDYSVPRSTLHNCIYSDISH